MLADLCRVVYFNSRTHRVRLRVALPRAVVAAIIYTHSTHSFDAARHLKQEGDKSTTQERANGRLLTGAIDAIVVVAHGIEAFHHALWLEGSKLVAQAHNHLRVRARART